MSIFKRILRAGEGKKVRALSDIVPDINALEAEMQKLSDDALRAKTGDFRQRLANGADLNDLLVEAFAVTREASQRVIGQRHYDVQLMGGAALHFGWIAEMRTGEGKTLVSTLPVYLNGLTGKGVHLVTVNDYLAKRDADWMGQIHRWLGLSVGIVIPEVNDSAAKRAAYAADVTYSTNSELGFDYLRDNMAMSLEERVQRKPYFAIVDEVDSILIDEARTPHIISGRVADAAKLYVQFAAISRSLVRGTDYDVDEEKKQVFPTESGIDKVEAALGVENIYDDPSADFVHHLNAALRAKELYRRDVEYLVQNGEVNIVDEFTGRVLEGRRWSEGLHQAVEAKERVKIKEENQTLATTTLQNYFRMYEKLAGMTGTAETEAGEFYGTYNLSVVPIPTHRPLVRVDQADLIYKSEKAKFDAVAADIAERHEKGQPVLVGTVSVEKSEYLSSLLNERGIPHEVLNAKQHAREAEIVAQAGRIGAVTVATNMAGRGVDILLGGNPEGLARRDVAAAGHNLQLLDLDPGDPQVFEMLEADADLATARRAAIDAFEASKAHFAADCAEEGKKIRELGGLYVLATERHESRRIDNQLRGRSGRQGDPGESRFYLSLDDDLMRLFATGAMNWVMGKALPDDVPIEAKMVTKAIERAQTTVEGRNAEIRKNVLKYDEVMNEQRKVIYTKRDQVLTGSDLDQVLRNNIESVVEDLVNANCVSDVRDDWNFESLLHDAQAMFPTQFSIEDLQLATSRNQLIESLTTEAQDFYTAKEEKLGAEVARDVERNVYLSIIDQRWREHLADMDYLQEGIHLRAMGQKDPLVEWQREGYAAFGGLMATIEQDFVRYCMHAEVVVEAEAPDIRDLSYTSAEEGTAPAALTGLIGADVSQLLAAQDVVEVEDEDGFISAVPASSVAGGITDAPSLQPVVKTDIEKIGRNEPCWCGSGKKFKNCHGR
jgi:preprotein translocase subunit SecA